MTIASEVDINTYTGNGSTLSYDYDYKILDEDHLRVTVRDSAGEETRLTIDTHYTVAGVGDGAGGTITLVAGAFTWIDGSSFFESGWTLMLRRTPELLQPTSIRNGATMDPAAIEGALDRLTTICQKLQNEVDRSVKIPETENPSSYSLILPAEAERASGAIVFDADGDVTVGTGELPDITVSSFAETFLDDTTAGAVRTTLGIDGTSNVVVFGDIQNIDTGRLLGRTATGTGDVTQITVGSTLTLASTNLDVANDGVTYAKIQNVSSTSRLLGRTTAGAGDIEELSLANGLEFGALTLGVVIASQANMEAQTASKMVDAAVLKYHPAAAKAWVLVTYSAGVPVATVSNNVTSLTDVGTGDLTVNFTTAFSTANYCSVITARRAASDSALFGAVKQGTAPTGSALAIQTLTVAPAAEDAAQVSVACFGDL